MKFKVLNRERVAQYRVDVKHIVISFRDPELEKAELPETNLRVGELYLAFHDLDEKCGDYKLFTKDDAKEIWKFINKHLSEIEMIIVNCEAGISRSSAVAAAISKILNGNDDDFFKYFIPNRLVYRKMMEVKS